MTSIESAESRLKAAIARLEAAVKKRPAAAPSGDEELATRLDAVRGEYTALKATTDQVAGRLDVMIERLRGLLGDRAGAG